MERVAESKLKYKESTIASALTNHMIRVIEQKKDYLQNEILNANLNDLIELLCKQELSDSHYLLKLIGMEKYPYYVTDCYNCLSAGFYHIGAGTVTQEFTLFHDKVCSILELDKDVVNIYFYPNKDKIAAVFLRLNSNIFKGDSPLKRS